MQNMPQMYRRGSKPSARPQTRTGVSYYRPARRKSRNPLLAELTKIAQRIMKLPRRFLIIMGACVLVIALGITGVCLLTGKKGANPTLIGHELPGKPRPTPTAMDPTVALPPRAAPLAAPAVTPSASTVRDISFGSMNLNFKEKLINQPGIFGNELFFSAGSGQLEAKDDPLKKLYIYNVENGEEEKVADVKLAGGGAYETCLNQNWLVWVETDHYTYNYIYVMNRATGEKTQIKNCKNGKPKLKLAGDTLVWLEPVDKTKDQLMMFDLKSQENLTLTTIEGTDTVTYGLSAPGIYVEPPATAPGSTTGPTESPTASPTPTPTPTPTATAQATPAAGEDGLSDDETGSTLNTTILWANTDKAQTADQKQAEGEHSTIYWLKLGADAIMDDSGTLKTSQFSPGTYVHDPLYNGKYFVWIDSNYAIQNSKLYISEPNGKLKVIDEGITTYSLGEDIVVYGKSQQVWVYVISTGEYCRLTAVNEEGMLPAANGRTVVWYDKTDGGVEDSVRYKVLADADILPVVP